MTENCVMADWKHYLNTVFDKIIVLVYSANMYANLKQACNLSYCHFHSARKQYQHLDKGKGTD